MTSSASSSVRGGRIVGSLRASIVLPEPGGPTINMFATISTVTIEASQ